MVDNVLVACGGCTCIVVLVLLIVLLSTGLKTIDQMEWCLRYNWWSMQVDEEPLLEAGITWVGPGNYLICYPNTNHYVYFRNFAYNMIRREGDVYQGPLGVRTADGLSIDLEMEFVYRINPSRLRAMYMDTGNQGFQHIMVKLAVGALDNEATNHNAQTFYEDRKTVQEQFEHAIREKLDSTLGLEVKSLQLQPAHFPDQYTDAITATQVAMEDIKVANQEQLTTRVQKQTEYLQAETLVRRAVIAAEAEAERVQLNNGAETEMYETRQLYEAQGFAEALSFFSNFDDFMSYLDTLSMREHLEAAFTVQVPSIS